MASHGEQDLFPTEGPAGPRVRPALVLSTDTTGLGVIRALGGAGVPVVAVHYTDNHIGQVSRYVTASFRTPRPLREEEAFVQALLDRAGRFEGGLLVPASDSSLVAVARHREALAERYVVAAPAWDVVGSFIDKPRTYALAAAAGVAVPETLVPRSEEEAIAYADRATYPCLVKPSVGHLYLARFRTKMVFAPDRDRLLEAYRRATDAGLEVMLQEWIPGPDDAGANYNAYRWDGSSIEFTAKKIRNAPPTIGSPCVVRSERVEGVLEPGRATLAALGLEGFACTEFKRDTRDGVWKLMEVNGRHNLSSVLAVRCGINFPLLQYRHLIDGAAPAAADAEAGRYWVDVLRDLRLARRTIARDGFGAFFRPYAGPTVYAVPDRHDPKPIGLQVFARARGAARRLLRRDQREAREANRSTSAT